MEPAAPDRIRTLDLIRGVAVLGILTVNITSFAAGDAAIYSPDLPRPGSAADHFAYLATLVLFDGKMRALFSMLFGASMVLFIERSDATGGDGAALQMRRLGWLLLLGYLHFALIWDGDILFIYAAIGLAAMAFRQFGTSQKLIGAVLALMLWQTMSSAMWIPALSREAAIREGSASPSQQRDHAAVLAQYQLQDATRRTEALLPWTAEVAARLTDRPAHPFTLTIYNWGETLAYMLLGMALLQSGFFAGMVQRRTILWIAVGGIGLGAVASLGFALWCTKAGYPDMMMRYMLGVGLAFARAAMALAYAAILVLISTRLLSGHVGRRLEAAGRMAFTNYITTSLIMTGLFHGWGLGLFGQFGAAQLWLFVLLGWALMLGWSKPWLARFRQGPLEWVWRSLTLWQVQPFLRR